MGVTDFFVSNGPRLTKVQKPHLRRRPFPPAVAGRSRWLGRCVGCERKGGIFGADVGFRSAQPTWTFQGVLNG